MIEITNEQIDRVNLILGGIPKAAEKTFATSINRGLNSVRTQSAKLVSQTYHITQREVKRKSNMKVKRANFTNLAGQIAFAGSVIPLIKFKVSPKEPKKQRVTVSVLKDEGGKRLQSAFVADLGRYGTGVFQRETRKRDSSKQLFGPSAAHMMGNVDVLADTEDKVQEIINKRIEHNITRILNGYV